MPELETVESIPNPGRTIEGLRDTGYSFETAVADLIDNSIAADATKISVVINMDFSGEIQLSISDNGCGMDKDQLQLAMRYGSPKRPDPASLGKYGLGLKTASTAFCRRLSLISRPSGSSPVFVATWDLDHVVRTEKWELQLSNEPDEESLNHLNEIAADNSGTVVVWNKIDRILRDYQNPTGKYAKNALRKRCSDLKQHVAMTYQRFLDKTDKRAHNIRITINGEVVQPWDPFQKTLSELVAEDSVEVEDTDAKFNVRAYILPRRDEFPNKDLLKEARLSSNMQGLYIFREQRLIHKASWLGMYAAEEPHTTLLRVEFSFDHKLDDAFQLDIKKSQIVLNDSLWKWLKDQFLPAPRRAANDRYRKGVNRVISNKAESAHDASNNAIRNKEAEVGGANVSINDPATGDVTVENSHGLFKMKLKVTSASKPGEVFVQPAQDVQDGLLFEPALIEQHKAVRINTEHPYYHKVYVPNLNQSVTVQGIDSLLWALCVAELNATTDMTKDAFGDMRLEVTRILRKLVESLPDPQIDQDQNSNGA